MRRIKISYFILFQLFTFSILISQNENSKWYFGNNAGLDFMTSPPTILTNGALTTGEGCASIADEQGNLLFYTDGTTIWNKNHTAMANGTGLTGNSSSTQSAIILKKPSSSNLYYVFTLGISGTGTLAYSVVDMNLASGNGSVTSINNTLAINCTEKLTAVQHSNGIDFWIISHKWNSANFQCFLLTGTGVSQNSVLSTIGSIHTGLNNFAGYIKASPNGKQIALAIISAYKYELFDFDKTTGVLSNSMSLPFGSTYAVYGCEFSPDGSKLYGSSIYTVGILVQWDLCAGSYSAILNSRTNVTVTTGCIGALQRASDGKIYVARCDSVLGIINNPNSLGLACNYVAHGKSITPKSTTWSLPNFMPLSITYTSNCKAASFKSRFGSSNVVWNFGEPSSGANNTSTLSNPTHNYSNFGNYTVTLINNSGGCSGSDTLYLNIFLFSPASNLNVSGHLTICEGEKYTYTASGANSYTWSNGLMSNTISLSPLITTVYSLTAATATNNNCSTSTIFTVTVNKCLSTNQNNLDQNILSIYPNPTTKELNIQSQKKLKLDLYNLDNQLISSEVIGAGLNQIHVENFKDGVYLLKIVCEGNTFFKRVIKISD